MKNRIIALIFIIALNINFVSFSKEFDPQYDEEVKTLSALGIINSSEFDVDKTTTRAEFIDAVVRLSGYSEQDISSNSDHIFWDVPADYWASGSINIAYKSGLVSGVGNNNFNPDGEISVNQVSKITVTLLGWQFKAEQDGGYPSGYMLNTQKLKISNGISGETALKSGDMAKILFKCLDADMLVPSSFTNENGDFEHTTLLYSSFKIEKQQGVITANYYSGLTGDSNIQKNEIIIDNVKFETSTSVYDALLGYKVKYYYNQENMSNLPVLVFAYYSSSNIEKRINANDLKDYKEGSYSYEMSGKIIMERVPASVKIIYNGKFASKFDYDIYVPKTGNIKLLDNNGDNTWDVLFVNSYENIIVSRVDLRDMILYDKFDIQKQIYLTSDDFIIDYAVKDMSGNSLELNSIKENTVLGVSTSTDGKLINLVVCNQKVEGTITEVNESESEYKINDKVYQLSSVYDQEKQGIILLNQTGTAHLGVDGSVVWFNTKSNLTKKYGYLINVRVDDNIDKSVILKIFSASGVMEILTLKTNVKINEQSYKVSQTVTNMIIGVKNNVLLYSVDSNGLIDTLDLPYSSVYDVPLGMNALHIGYKSTAPLEYKSFASTFAGKVNIDTNTVIFNVPTDEESDDRLYSILKTDFFGNDKEYTVNSYKVKADTLAAEAIVIPKSSAAAVADNASLALVTKFSQGVNQDGEWKTIVTVFSDGTEKKLFLENEGLLSFTISEIVNNATTTYTTTMQIGDVIRFGLNSFGEISQVELAYDHDMSNILNASSHVARLYNHKFKLMFSGVFNKVGKVFVAAPINGIENTKAEDSFNYMLVSASKIYVFDYETKRAYIGSEADLLDYKHVGSNFSKILFRTEYAQPKDIIIYKKLLN